MILYTTQRFSTTREVITTALYCKHRSNYRASEQKQHNFIGNLGEKAPFSLFCPKLYWLMAGVLFYGGPPDQIHLLVLPKYVC